MAIFAELLAEPVPPLAISFFQVFSRFECALKRSGTYAIGDDFGVNPDWDKFARDLGPKFLEDVIASRAAPVLIEKPPKKQVKLQDNSLGWRDMGSVKSTADLLLAVRRTRNNLIHGGKYRDSGYGRASMVEGSERDETLLNESLSVLAMALERNQLVHEHFGRV